MQTDVFIDLWGLLDSNRVFLSLAVLAQCPVILNGPVIPRGVLFDQSLIVWVWGGSLFHLCFCRFYKNF